ncbi:type VI secretion protein [Streptomyces sp. NPDC060194]|uniref:type VI secretion protein n=1 Tax=Streptomyces sp. NPDC060194 TaxID=3347069 RepID=UPI003666151D
MAGEQQRGTGGVPDGLVLGLLGFLLSLTALVWTATGAAGLLVHGSWPDGVAFSDSPAAIRSLATAPEDLPAAWPATPRTQLPGYGLFWGILLGEIMVGLVLAVFVLGTVTRARAVRAARRAPGARLVPGTEPRGVPEPQESRPAQPRSSAQVPTAAVPLPPQHRAEPSRPGTPLPPPITVPALSYGPPAARRTTALRAIADAPGAVLVLTSDPALWEESRSARAKLGPVHVYDPTHRTDAAVRLHWSPTADCEDRWTAAARAHALLAPVRPGARRDAATADTAETLLRSWLHAAALDGRPVKHVHRWAQGTQPQEPVTILRTHADAAAGAAGELESALTSHDERRSTATALVAHALAAHASLHIREACTANRADTLALASFVPETGTLYVVGEPVEDPRAHPGAVPLLTALTASVVEHGRRMAARSTDGRLDLPLTLVLDDVAAVAPIPRLPELLRTSGRPYELPTYALMRSQEQARSRWPNSSQWTDTLPGTAHPGGPPAR